MPIARRLLRLMLVSAFVLSLATATWACPNCKEAVSAQPSELAGMAQGYNWSVLLMLAVPFSLACTGTLMVVRAAKRGSLPEL
jgi:hypothetical protein